MVEYITEDGLFSIDLVLRPPPGQQPASDDTAAAQPHVPMADGSNGSSDSSGQSSHHMDGTGGRDPVSAGAADEAQAGEPAVQQVSTSWRSTVSDMFPMCLAMPSVFLVTCLAMTGPCLTAVSLNTVALACDINDSHPLALPLPSRRGT